MGISLPQLLADESARAAKAKAPTDVNCIFIWSVGGASHHDTFDPKPDAAASIRGEFGTIDTSVPGMQFSEVMPRFAKELGRFGVLRGWNPRNNGHGIADYYCMTGFRPNPSLIRPCHGSVISHHKGFKTTLPPFMQLGKDVNHVSNGGLPGFLGLEHGAFGLLNDPNAANFSVPDFVPPAGVDGKRVSLRSEMLALIDRLQRKTDRQPRAYDAIDKHYKAALDIITSPKTARAFDLNQEKPKLRDAYGRHTFGQRFLLARRLIESGVRFVTVTTGGWDHHGGIFKGLKSAVPPVDQALPQLLIDLEDRGMLKNTLVVWMSDFGRTPKINAAGGRDHWATAGFVVMAGAGVPGGSIVGKTSADGGVVADDEYFTEDVTRTIYAKLGISHDAIVKTPDGRPGRLVPPDAKLISQWM